MDEFTYQDNNPIYENQTELTDLEKLEEWLNNALPNYNVERTFEDWEKIIELSCEEHEACLTFYESGDLYYSFQATDIEIISDWRKEYLKPSFDAEFIKAIFTYQNYLNYA